MNNYQHNKTEIHKFTKELDTMFDKMNSLGNSEVDLNALFSREFMMAHIRVTTFEDFLKVGNFNVKSKADFEAIPDDVFDEYVLTHTDFSSWDEMLETATDDYIQSQLNF